MSPPAADPPDPLTPHEPEITPSDPSPAVPPAAPEVAPPSEPPALPSPTPDPVEVPPPGVPLPGPGLEPDVPDGPGIADPDLAPGAPLGPPSHAPAPPSAPSAEAPSVPEEYDMPSDWFAPFDTASLPPDHPAYDRIQSRAARARRSGPVSLFLGAALVVAGLVVTYLLVRPDPGGAAVPDLLTLTAAHTEAVRLDVATSDLDEAEEFIIGEFGWPIRVPVLPDTRLEGVGVAVLAEGVEVPVLRYQQAGRPPITVYAYDYAFLDAAADHLALAPPVYARLAEDPPVDVRRVGDAFLVLWRRRAAIYTAVTSDDPAPLVEYLRRR